MWSMQRLFGTFPDRGAGLALVLLRLTVAVCLVTRTSLCPSPEAEVLSALSRVAAVFFVIGLFTPIVSITAVFLSLGALWLCSEPLGNSLLIAILIAIALLGAGAYSLDARLYGRRRLVAVRGGGKTG
jgi:uncharacterized membrane protein YphA (DoxX/SURF4 family)